MPATEYPKIVREQVWTDAPLWSHPTAAMIVDVQAHMVHGRRTTIYFLEIEGSEHTVTAALFAIRSHSRYFLGVKAGVAC